jgi:hypothetical protein
VISRRRQAALGLFVAAAILSGCRDTTIEAEPVKVEQSQDGASTYVLVSLDRKQHENIQKSGETLALNIFECDAGPEGAVSFGADREPVSGTERSVTIRFVIWGFRSIQRTLDQRCGVITSHGYSLSSFKSRPFRIG